MYLPAAFNETRIEFLHDAIGAIGFATLVSAGGDGALLATHLPLLLDLAPAPFGTLIGHVARANPHWRTLAEGAGNALAIFLGPQGYVSPNWYPTKRAHGKVVPTWNYVAVHAYGRVELVEEREALRAIVTRLTDRHEAAAGSAAPWKVSDAPPDFTEQMLKGIVGLRLPIARLEGKWKLSQNRSPEDRAGVVAGLDAQGEAAAALAKAMRKRP
jgi:transcriptional regulator